MPTYRTQVSIATADNVAANFATNTFHVLAPDLAELALWHSALLTFYQGVDTLMSSLVRTSDGFMCKSYDIADPEPRAPVLTFEGDLSPTAGNPLPPEVSLVMSFQAEQSSGVPQARRRNRIYLPFFTSATNSSTGRPTDGAVDSVVGAAQTLLNASGPTSGDWQWVVYSPTDATFDLVNNGWVDDEWDTQRRRGRPALSRDIFSV